MKQMLIFILLSASFTANSKDRAVIEEYYDNPLNFKILTQFEISRSCLTKTAIETKDFCKQEIAYAGHVAKKYYHLEIDPKFWSSDEFLKQLTATYKYRDTLNCPEINDYLDRSRCRINKKGEHKRQSFKLFKEFRKKHYKGNFE